MSGVEIERKFLVHKSADWKKSAHTSHHIQQGYFAAVNTVRIRIQDDFATRIPITKAIAAPMVSARKSNHSPLRFPPVQ